MGRHVQLEQDIFKDGMLTLVNGEGSHSLGGINEMLSSKPSKHD